MVGQFRAGAHRNIEDLHIGFNYAKGVHIARFVNRNDAVFGSPWSTGLGADGLNGVGQLVTVESSAKSLFRGWTIGMNKRFANRFRFQWNYMLSTDYSDDDQERDPFNFYYAVANNFKPDYNYSSRDERHRFNAFGLREAPLGFELSSRISAHTAQPTSVGNVPGGSYSAQWNNPVTQHASQK